MNLSHLPGYKTLVRRWIESLRTLGSVDVTADFVIVQDATDGQWKKAQAEDVGTFLDTDDALSADSDARVASQSATKSYVDDQVSSAGSNIGTQVATTSGTTASMTGIASGVNRILIGFNGVSDSAGQAIALELGDSGGYETSGYAGGLDDGATTYSSAFVLVSNANNDAGDALRGHVILTRVTGNTWAFSSHLYNGNGTRGFHIGGGTKTLSSELDRLQLTIASGAFDSGSFNIEYG